MCGEGPLIPTPSHSSQGGPGDADSSVCQLSPAQPPQDTPRSQPCTGPRGISRNPFTATCLLLTNEIYIELRRGMAGFPDVIDGDNIESGSIFAGHILYKCVPKKETLEVCP